MGFWSIRYFHGDDTLGKKVKNLSRIVKLYRNESLKNKLRNAGAAVELAVSSL